MQRKFSQVKLYRLLIYVYYEDRSFLKTFLLFIQKALLSKQLYSDQTLKWFYLLIFYQHFRLFNIYWEKITEWCLYFGQRIERKITKSFKVRIVSICKMLNISKYTIQFVVIIYKILLYYLQAMCFLTHSQTSGFYEWGRQCAWNLPH